MGNKEFILDAYEAFARRDMASVMKAMSPDVTFIVPGRSIQSGVFAGVEEVKRYFSIVGKHSAGTHRLDVLEVLEGESRIAVLVRAVGDHGDKRFDQLLVHLWTIDNGKLTELHLIPTDQYAFDNFWS